MRTRTLFHVLEDKLQASRRPLTCNDLIDDPEVREFTNSANRVSDYLGALWRRGTVAKVPAPRTRDSAARWAYEWKKNVKADNKVSQLPNTTLKSVGLKSKMEVTEIAGGVKIEMGQVVITIRSK